MIARSWSFLSGMPLGVLGILSLVREPALLQLLVGGLAGAILLLLAALLAARRGDDAPDRHLHVARAASAAWASLPAVAAVAFDLGPPAWGWFAGLVAWLTARLWHAGRVAGDSGGARRLVFLGVGALVVGTLAVPALCAIWAAVPIGGTELDPDVRTAAYHLDSVTALEPHSSCEPRMLRSTVLVAGAAPRLAADSRFLWYEAPGPEGRRQIHRLDRSGGAIRCWTCGQPGNNRRPAPHPSGPAVLFDTDRFATFWQPRNSEVMVTVARGEVPEGSPRRLTHDPGADDHAIYDPSGQGFVASIARAGRYRIARRAIRTGHGGVVLGSEQGLLSSGAAWGAALAWSPDARSLVAVRGSPLVAGRGLRLDPAADEQNELDTASESVVDASFSPDGSGLALVSTLRIRVAGLLAAGMGGVTAAVVGPRATLLPALHRGTVVRLGDSGGNLISVELGEIAEWGVPTGISLSPESDAFALGQRREDEERVLWVELDCGVEKQTSVAGRPG